MYVCHLLVSEMPKLAIWSFYSIKPQSAPQTPIASKNVPCYFCFCERNKMPHVVQPDTSSLFYICLLRIKCSFCVCYCIMIRRYTWLRYHCCVCVCSLFYTCAFVFVCLVVYFTLSGFCRSLCAVSCSSSSQQVCKLFDKQNDNVGQGWRSC